MMQRCEHCIAGTVLPRYRKDREPTYRCNQCGEEYIPQSHSGGVYLTHTDLRIRRALRMHYIDEEVGFRD